MKPVPPKLAEHGIQRLEDNREGREVVASVKIFWIFFDDRLEDRFIKFPPGFRRGFVPIGPHRP